jgi:hypothetical protein
MQHAVQPGGRIRYAIVHRPTSFVASEDDDRAVQNSNAAGPLDLRYEKGRRRRTAFADVRDY